MFDIADIVSFNKATADNPLHIYESMPAGLGGMSPGQAEYHQSAELHRLLIGGNQIGKSRALSYECWAHALGRHKHREVPAAGNLGWIMCADLKSGWASFSAKLREIQPAGILDESCTYDVARGYMYRSSKIIKLRNGSTMVGKSGSQDIMALASATIDWLAIDELPKQMYYGEALSRCAVNSAPVFMGFTPINRPVNWLRSKVSGDPETGAEPTEKWEVIRIELTPENCPHRTPESIEQQISVYGPWEYQQRVLGHWEGTSSERWISFSEDNVFTDAPANIEAVGLGWDHGERPGNSVCYLVASDTEGTLWVLAEYVSTERNTPHAEAIEITEMLKAWGVGLDQIDTARGDSNSAGRLGLGFTVNEMLERSFAKILKRSRAPFPIETPWKGKGSIKSRARLLSAACLDGRFRVHKDCTKLISALRHWKGANDDYKHHYDAVSYIAEHYLSESMDNVSRFMIG